MSREQEFFVCKHCGNLITLIHSSGASIICCGDTMTKLVPNTVEASAEKHLPVISLSKSTISVDVGSIAHPMLAEHHIKWIYIVTNKGGQIKYLEVGQEPKAVFEIIDDEIISAYAFCNLHGLWKTDLK